MRGKLVTLIGGGGFLGRYVAGAFLREGARLRIVQRDPRHAYGLKSLGQLGGVHVVAADIGQPETVARAVAGSDAVVNLVGLLAGDFQRAHVDGARNVAEAAAREGVAALVHTSAIGADPASPSNYGRTKGEGEAAVLAAFPQASILRPSVVFGREDQFLNRFAGLIAALPIVPIVSPATRFQPVFAGDVADAVAVAVRDPGTHGGRTYELGGPDILSMADLNRFIARETGRTPHFVELPDGVGSMIARAGFLPGAPITWDQWLMLRRDNVVGAGMPGLEAFGVTPTPMATIAPSYLVQYRRAGRFGRRAALRVRPEA
ncbi:complex I NDUFA9 subunit family protein [uncultured Sphingomonas sp.]|uniref:complex I NDUFA9 subunit family protein n=1 Tax=uncultured Sphingomonas sp. TaxID=158754 RepID=UPI0035CBC7A1